jgi:hypothetical protein
MMKTKLPILSLIAALVLATACTPTVKVEAPDKPIEINMNIKIEQEVRVRVDKDLDRQITANPDLFGVPKKSSSKR